MWLATGVMLLVMVKWSRAQQTIDQARLLREEKDVTWVREGDMEHEVYVLWEGGQYANITNSLEGGVQVVCHPGQEPRLDTFWSSSHFRVLMSSLQPPASYKVYQGPNVTWVKEQASVSDWRDRLVPSFPWVSPTHLKVDPFQHTCVGVTVPSQAQVVLQVRRVDFYLVLITMAGLAVFFLAPKLARSSLVFYSTGVSLGVLLSLMIAIYFIQKRLGYSPWSWVGLLYSLALYLMTNTWRYWSDLWTDQYLPWVTGYILMSGLLSWAWLYRQGHDPHPRTLNLVTWGLHLSGLGLVVFSSYQMQASLALVLALLVWAIVPDWVKSRCNTQVRKRLFAKNIKLLSEAEYQAQSNVETRKALQELRRYCSSPDSRPWRTVTQLRDPRRFADFIHGSPHLTEGEVMQYSTWDSDHEDSLERDEGDLTDDESAGAVNTSFDSEY